MKVRTATDWYHDAAVRIVPSLQMAQTVWAAGHHRILREPGNEDESRAYCTPSTTSPITHAHMLQLIAHTCPRNMRTTLIANCPHALHRPMSHYKPAQFTRRTQLYSILSSRSFDFMKKSEPFTVLSTQPTPKHALS
jgi:hypothetical protein